jgi:tetratricopeptide (TPR) repeat protein
MILPLVGAGRVDDLRRLEALAESTCSGQGEFVVVTGEPGIGKTHLLKALVGAVSERMTVAWGAGTSWPGTEPFGVWAQILPVLARPMEPADAEDDESPTPVGPGDVRWPSIVSRLVAPMGDSIEPIVGGYLARLQLFDDVRALIRTAASARPVLVVIDDLQLVHPSALDLLSFLVPALSSMPVAVVAAGRAGSPGEDGADLERLRSLVRQGDTMALSGLEPEATAQLVIAAGAQGVDRDVSDAIHRHSGGNPLFALELTRLIAGRDPVDARSAFEDSYIPATVMAVVAERVRSLSDDAKIVLDVAAVLGPEFREIDLREVIGAVATEVAVEAAIAELVRGSLVESMRRGQAFSFTHGVLREAVYAEIPVGRRRQLHRAVVDVAGSPERPDGTALAPAELADHLLASDAPRRLERAADELASTARSEMAVHAYVEALRHADQAIGLVGDTGERGAELLVDRGTALLALGEVEQARATFGQAAERARSADAPVLLARAALGVGSGETGFEVPLLDVDQIDLLREALERLPAPATSWRARLQARLSVALTSTDDPLRGDVSDEAVRVARASEDPATLAAALAAHCDVLAGPDHTEAREAWSTDVIDLAKGCSDPGLELLGLRLRLVSRLEQGDMVGAITDAEDFSVIADRLDQPTFLWYPHLWRAMRLLLSGQSEAALGAAAEAGQEGRRAHSVNAELLVLTHRWIHWVQIGDTAALRRLIEEFDDGDALPRATWAWVSLAFGFAQLGRLNAARLRLDAVADELRSAPRDSEWVPMLAQVAEAVSLCGGHPVAEWAYEALLPYRAQHIVEGIGAVALGSVEHPLGQLAAARGDSAAATQHFVAALSANRLLGSPPLVARTLRHAGVALRDADRCAEARELYEELGWQRRVALLDLSSPVEPVRGGSPQPRNIGRMLRDGDGWELGFEDVTVHLQDSKGLHDLAVLLYRPHVEVAALDLVGSPAGRTDSGRDPRSGSETPGGSEGNLGPVLDQQARSAYQARVVELDDQIEEVKSMADPVRLERAENERDLILAELASAYGLGGAPRRPGDPAERARTTVTSRIRYAIDRVERAHPALGRHLRHAVVTGRFCCYRPEKPVTWEM